jgi:hypothetical protein
MIARLFSRCRRALLVACVAAAGALAAAGTTGAARSDNARMLAVLVQADVSVALAQQAFARCLQTERQACGKAAGAFAAAARRAIAAIRAAGDGSEISCLRAVARRDVQLLALYRSAALAYAQERPKVARRLFQQSLPVDRTLQREQKACFAALQD